MHIPQALKQLPHPPTNLYVRGTLPDPQTHTYLSIVGSRNQTKYGMRVCADLIAALENTNTVIVSGLGVGTDLTAHKAALEANLPTIAILASGLSKDTFYPPQHFDIAEDILKASGALLSEYDQKATLQSFPARNRLIAGLSPYLLYIEGSTQSAALTTAMLALEYNKNILTVPHPIYSPTSPGAGLLLGLGATPITSTNILKEELGFPTTQAPSILSKAEQTVLTALSTKRTTEELNTLLTLPKETLSHTLRILEIKGYIRHHLGYIEKTQT